MPLFATPYTVLLSGIRSTGPMRFRYSEPLGIVDTLKTSFDVDLDMCRNT